MDTIPATNLTPAPTGDEEPPLYVIRRQFPRIASAIELMWGDRDLDGYLQKLIVADRGDRVGFPKEVLAALLKLSRQHDARFKFQTPIDEWAQEDRIDRVKFRKEPGSAAFAETTLS